MSKVGKWESGKLKRKPKCFHGHTMPDRISTPVIALQEATYWWHEYGKEALAFG